MVFSLSVIRSGPGHSAHRRLITGGLRLGVDQDCACADSDVLPHEVLWWVCTALPHSIRLVRHAGVWGPGQRQRLCLVDSSSWVLGPCSAGRHPCYCRLGMPRRHPARRRHGPGTRQQLRVRRVAPSRTVVKIVGAVRLADHEHPWPRSRRGRVAAVGAAAKGGFGVAG